LIAQKDSELRAAKSDASLTKTLLLLRTAEFESQKKQIESLKAQIEELKRPNAA
jgi:hypothetical protein